MPRVTTRSVFWPWLPVVLLTLSVTPAGAAAGTVKTTREDGAVEAVRYTAASGELNWLTVTVGGDHLEVRDVGARVRARGACRRVSVHRARCPIPDDAFVATLGDGDDRASLRGLAEAADVFGYMSGGGGDDVLVAGPDLCDMVGGRGRDRLTGAAGNDDLLGGHGPDILRGGRGEDDLDGGPGTDDLKGGPGYDQLDIRTGRGAVRVDLRRQPGRTRPDRDRFDGFEYVATTGAFARLTGDALNNSLYARGGRSRLAGRGGSDGLATDGSHNLLLGGAGGDNLDVSGAHNTLRGGAGPDSLLTVNMFFPLPRRERPNQLSCGPGAHDEIQAAPWDTVDGCELAVGWEFDFEVTVEPRFENTAAVFSATCRGDRCAGRVTLESPDRDDYGAADFEIPGSITRPRSEISVPLTEAGRTAIAAGAPVRTTFRSSSHLYTGTDHPLPLGFGYTVRMEARSTRNSPARPSRGPR